mgnify:FL=1
MDHASHFYHCATKGFQRSILFADANEFIAGMNRIAICSARACKAFPVIVIAFCLMDNHVHFILHGTRENCLRWMALFHRLTMVWQGHHRNGNPVSEPWEYDAWQIFGEEDLKEKIAYVLRNPMLAGQACLPTNYRWSSGPLVFGGEPVAKGRPIGSMSGYECRKAFDTRIALPGEWLMMPDGLIWPGCYTNYQHVERLFGSPAGFMFAMNQKVEAKVNQELLKGQLSLPDQDIRSMAMEMAKKQYDTEKLETLDLEQRIVLSGQLVKKPGVNLKQIARVIGIDYGELKRLFS